MNESLRKSDEKAAKEWNKKYKVGRNCIVERKPKVKKKKEKPIIPMTTLRNGKTPATEKQLKYIKSLLIKSRKRYDFYYERDKYYLTKDKAGAFIQAIKNQQPFSFRNKYEAKDVDLDSRLDFLINKEDDYNQNEILQKTSNKLEEFHSKLNEL